MDKQNNSGSGGSKPPTTPFQLPSSSWPPSTDAQNTTGNLWATAGHSRSWMSGPSETSPQTASTTITTATTITSNPVLPVQVSVNSSTNQFAVFSSTTQGTRNIFTNTFTQAAQGNAPNPFGGVFKGKPEVANVFGTTKVDTSVSYRTYGVDVAGKTKSETLSGRHAFDRVSSSDSKSVSGNIFGSVSSASVIPKVFGGGTDHNKEVMLAETSKEAARHKMAGKQGSTSDAGFKVPSILSAPSTAHKLFGGRVASSSSTTESQLAPSSNLPFGGAVDSSSVTVPSLFGGSVGSSSTVKPSTTRPFSETVGSSSITGIIPSTQVVAPVFGGSVSSSVTPTASSGTGLFGRVVNKQSMDSSTRSQLPSSSEAATSVLFGGGNVEMAKGATAPVFSDTSIFGSTSTSLSDGSKKEKLFGATSTSDIPNTSSMFGGISSGPQSTDNRASKGKLDKEKLFGKSEPSGNSGFTTEPIAGGSEKLELGEIPNSTVATSTPVPVFSVSNAFASTTTSKSTSIDIRSSSEQQKNLFATTATSIFPFSTTPSLFGGTSSLTQSPPGDFVGKSSSQKLFSKPEVSEIDILLAEPMTEQDQDLEPGEIPDSKPDILPSLFGKSETQVSSESSPEFDKKELTKIIVAQIPDNCMDKEVLRRHFEKFGEIKRLMLVYKSNQAMIQYSNHHAASRAKRKGKKIHPKLPEVKIFYGTPARRKSEDGSTDAKLSKKKAIRRLQHTHTSPDLDPYTPIERPGSSSTDSPPIYVKAPKLHMMLTPLGVHEKTPVKTTRPSKSILSSQKSSHGRTKQYPPKPSGIDKHHSKLSGISKHLSKPSGISKHLSKPSGISKHLSKPSGISKHHSKPSGINKLEVPEKKQPTRPKSPVRESKETEVQDLKSSEALLEIQATSNNLKYRVLEQRDKFLKKERTRPTDIKQASFLAASCPDMCPEMERYMRDVQNDLSSYEMTGGKLDHKLAVKKYLRSSADKLEPLPHELRPGPVLMQTMDFLICNVVNHGDDEDTEIDVWYSYLWNRTRAVRNDLMMQQLTDSDSVAIMERCTRFHIHSAVRLCTEPVDLFDAKLNTEHLTKSLQTLKELYHDLGEKGEYFDSEAEFRAYEMLLNLNDGVTIIRYSQFREEVQKSSHVQFARKVFLAIANNNYVKFFRLIRNASYLQGCILHRYFRQVRSKALDTVMKSYGGKSKQLFPVKTMVKILGLEDEEDAVTYLSHHGIQVEDHNVFIDRSSFTLQPEEMPPIVRPVNLVEVNLSCSVGEVIQGGPIPDNPLHTHEPHDSFNSSGYLKSEALTASDQNVSSNKKTRNLDVPVSSRQPTRMDKNEVMFHSKYVYKAIESSVIEDLTPEVCHDSIEECKYEMVLEKNAQEVLQQCIESVLQKEVKIISKEVLCEAEREEEEARIKQKEEEEMRRKALEKLLNAASSSIHASYIAEFVDEFSSLICQEAYQEEEMSVILEDLTAEFAAMFCTEVLEEETRKTCEKVMEELSDQETKIVTLQRKTDIRLMGDCFRKWRLEAFRARRKKQARETFPAAASQLSIYEQNEALGWGYDRSRKQNLSAFSLSRLEEELKSVADKLRLRNQLQYECAVHPLVLKYHAMQNADKFFPEQNLLSQYFKVLLCIADDCTNSLVVPWLRSKLGSGYNNIQEPLTYSFDFISRRTGVEYGWVLHEALASSLCAEDIKGTSLILYLTSCDDAQNPQYCKVQDLCKTMPWISSYTVLYDCNSCNTEGWNLFEEDLFKPETSERLQCLLLDFWEKLGTQHRIVSKSFIHIIDGFISEKYVRSALHQQADRLVDGRSSIPPSALIGLYNAVVSFLINVIDDEELNRLDWPPPELSHLCQVPAPSWNNLDVRCNIELLSHMKLPELKVEGVMKWKCLKGALYKYARQVDDQSGIVLISHIDVILSQTHRELRPDVDVNGDWEVHVLQLPWVKLINACVNHKLMGLPFTPVFFQPGKLKSFKFPQSWWVACDSSERLETLNETSPSGLRKRKTEEHDHGDQDLFQPDKVQKVQSKLLSDIEAEKERYKEFERELKSVLDLDDDFLFPF